MSTPQFGKDRDPGIVAEQAPRTNEGTPKYNPCVIAYGEGPEGVTCKWCKHLRVQGGTAGTYYKCEFTGTSHSATTDHRVGWPACSKYVEMSRSQEAAT